MAFSRRSPAPSVGRSIYSDLLLDQNGLFSQPRFLAAYWAAVELETFGSFSTRAQASYGDSAASSQRSPNYQSVVCGAIGRTAQWQQQHKHPLSNLQAPSSDSSSMQHPRACASTQIYAPQAEQQSRQAAATILTSDTAKLVASGSSGYEATKQPTAVSNIPPSGLEEFSDDEDEDDDDNDDDAYIPMAADNAGAPSNDSARPDAASKDSSSSSDILDENQRSRQGGWSDAFDCAGNSYQMRQGQVGRSGALGGAEGFAVPSSNNEQQSLPREDAVSHIRDTCAPSYSQQGGDFSNIVGSSGHDCFPSAPATSSALSKRDLRHQQPDVPSYAYTPSESPSPQSSSSVAVAAASFGRASAATIVATNLRDHQRESGRSDTSGATSIPPGRVSPPRAVEAPSTTASGNSVGVSRFADSEVSGGTIASPNEAMADAPLNASRSLAGQSGTLSHSSYQQISQKPLEQPCSFMGKFRSKLVLDLDNTLLHACARSKMDFINIHLHDFLDPAGNPELYKFVLPQMKSQIYYVKFRPGVREFLKSVTEFCDLAIHTNATREYADVIVAILDPDGSLFQGRVAAREDDNTKDHKKDMDRLFGTDNLDLNSLIILDDRKDVWDDRYHPNIVQCGIYEYLDSRKQALIEEYKDNVGDQEGVLIAARSRTQSKNGVNQGPASMGTISAGDGKNTKGPRNPSVGGQTLTGNRKGATTPALSTISSSSVKMISSHEANAATSGDAFFDVCMLRGSADESQASIGQGPPGEGTGGGSAESAASDLSGLFASVFPSTSPALAQNLDYNISLSAQEYDDGAEGLEESADPFCNNEGEDNSDVLEEVGLANKYGASDGNDSAAGRDSVGGMAQDEERLADKVTNATSDDVNGFDGGEGEQYRGLNEAAGAGVVGGEEDEALSGARTPGGTLINSASPRQAEKPSDSLVDYDRQLDVLKDLIVEVAQQHRERMERGEEKEASIPNILSHRKGSILTNVVVLMVGMFKSEGASPDHGWLDNGPIHRKRLMNLGARVEDQPAPDLTHLLAMRQTQTIDRVRRERGDEVKYVHALWLHACEHSWGRVNESWFEAGALLKKYENKPFKKPWVDHWRVSGIQSNACQWRVSAAAARKGEHENNAESNVPLVSKELIVTGVHSNGAEIWSPFEHIVLRYDPLRSIPLQNRLKRQREAQSEQALQNLQNYKQQMHSGRTESNCYSSKWQQQQQPHQPLTSRYQTTHSDFFTGHSANIADIWEPRKRPRAAVANNSNTDGRFDFSGKATAAYQRFSVT